MNDLDKNKIPEHLTITAVVAISDNNAIGKDNKLLWYLPNDLKHFKNITTGNTVIMGRKTFDSVGKPLPNRRNIVITRQKDIKIPNVEVVNSLQEALSLCTTATEVFIVGGAEIYKQAMAITNKIYLTTVHEVYDADTFFPELKENEWLVVDKIRHEADEKNNLAYTFSTLKRL